MDILINVKIKCSYAHVICCHKHLSLLFVSPIKSTLHLTLQSFAPLLNLLCAHLNSVVGRLLSHGSYILQEVVVNTIFMEMNIICSALILNLIGHTVQLMEHI